MNEHCADVSPPTSVASTNVGQKLLRMKQRCLVWCTNPGAEQSHNHNKSISYNMAWSVPMVSQLPSQFSLVSASTTINRGGTP
jgi:hypothetical protein